MKTLKVSLASLLLLVATLPNALGQNADPEIVPAVKLDGPRVGMTFITPGKTASMMRDDLKINPFITQFGWQFETRYFTLPNGTCGLVEGVILVGGLEQGVLLPSGNLLIGIRNHKGFEFGFGPNLSVSGVGFVFALGTTFQSNYVYFPVNLAVVPSPNGLRISLLTGFNARKR